MSPPHAQHLGVGGRKFGQVQLKGQRFLRAKVAESGHVKKEHHWLLPRGVGDAAAGGGRGLWCRGPPRTGRALAMIGAHFAVSFYITLSGEKQMLSTYGRV